MADFGGESPGFTRSALVQPKSLLSEGNITKVACNLAFARKNRCHFWAFSVYFPVFGAPSAGNKTALNPGTRISPPKVLANYLKKCETKPDLTLTQSIESSCPPRLTSPFCIGCALSLARMVILMRTVSAMFLETVPGNPHFETVLQDEATRRLLADMQKSSSAKCTRASGGGTEGGAF